MVKQATAIFLTFVAVISQLLLGSQAPDLSASLTDSVAVLSGKSLLFIGDSMTDGHGMPSFQDSWCGMLGTDYGMEVSTISVSGSTIAAADLIGRTPGGCKEPMCRRSLPDEFYDIIFLEGSGNDWYCEIPLGEDPLERSEFTEMGALNVLIDRVQAQWPNSLVVCMTPWNSAGIDNGLGLTTEDYTQAVIRVCEARGIPCFHANDPAVTGIDASTPESRSIYFLSPSDQWHLNAESHRAYLPVIAGWLQTIVRSDYSVCGFTDVSPSAWYASAVAEVYNRRVMYGTGRHSFSPKLNLDRGSAVCILHRLADSPPVSFESGFSDVSSGTTLSSAVDWAVSMGISSGTSDTTFSPAAAVTREQLAVLLYHYARYRGFDLSPAAELSGYADADAVDQWAVDAMSWACAVGLLKGTAPDQLSPLAPVTRGQAAVIFRRFLTYLDADGVLPESFSEGDSGTADEEP